MDSSLRKYPLPSASVLTGRNTNCDVINFESWRDGQTQKLAWGSNGFESWRLRTLADLQTELARPGTSASRPGTSASRPGTSASRPGTSASRPGTSASYPGTSASRPGTSASYPGTSASRPGTSASRPGASCGPAHMASADLTFLNRPASKGSNRVAVSWSGPLVGMLEQQNQPNMFSSLSQDNSEQPLSRMSQSRSGGGALSRPGTSASASALAAANRSSQPLRMSSRPGSSPALQPATQLDSWTKSNLAALSGNGNALAAAQYSAPSKRRGRFQAQAMAVPAPATLIQLQAASSELPKSMVNSLGSSMNGATWQTVGASDCATVQPTRGMMFSVFQELDKFGVGKLTYTSLEDAGVKIGLKPDAVKELYSILDPKGRGYCTLQDWGKADASPKIQEYTRLYLQLRKPDDEFTLAPVKVKATTLNNALQLLVLKQKMKNHGLHVPQSMLLDPFQFADPDGTGVVSSEALQDIFNGIGIEVTPEVLQEAVTFFGPTDSNALEYPKFVETVYPRLVPDLLKEYRSRHTGIVDHPFQASTGY